MTTDLPEEHHEAAGGNDLDWDNRVLCSDGNCIGVIGADGRCKECGKEYEGELPEPAISEPNGQPEGEAEDLSTKEDLTLAEPESDSLQSAPVDDEWENRVLCSDGNCIGVIGPDGKCKECGKPME